MKERFVTLVTTGIVIVAGGAVFWLLPNFDAPRGKLSQAVGRDAEAGRRLLDEYSLSLSAVAGDPIDPIAPDLSADQVTGMIESDNRPAAEALDAEAERINTLRRDAYGQLRELDERLKSLDASAEVPISGPVRFGNNVNAMASAMRDGVSHSNKVASRIKSDLDKAAARLQAAVNEQVGELSGQDSLTAARLLAAAQMQKGKRAQREASVVGQDLLSVVNDLSALGMKAAEFHAATDLVSRSDVDRRIDDARRKVADAQEMVNERQQKASQLADSVKQIKDSIAQEEATADRARARMDELEMRGLRYEDPRAVESFRSQYEQLAQSYRTSLRAAQALKHGTLANARIDDTGDLLSGDYIAASDAEMDYQPGLDEYERQLTAAQSDVEESTRILEQVRREHERLEDMRRRLVAAQQDAIKKLAQVADQAKSMIDNYKELKMSVTGAEDEALQNFDKAAGQYKRAAAAAQRRVNDVPVDAVEGSAGSLMRDDRWLVAQVNAQFADANLAGASVLLDRMHRLTQARRVLENLSQSIDGLVDPDISAAEIDEAQLQGKDRAEKAVAALESASRDLRSHWTVAASLAAADYMLHLFGEPDMIEVAIANYQNVVNGREDNPLVQPYRDRLEQLKSR